MCDAHVPSLSSEYLGLQAGTGCFVEQKSVINRQTCEWNRRRSTLKEAYEETGGLLLSISRQLSRLARSVELTSLSNSSRSMAWTSGASARMFWNRMLATLKSLS